ncbi:MAG TPA: DUF4062 domain-containing protein [bacterium]|nr:DUF4062 domain-containing protein [bacterium]
MPIAHQPSVFVSSTCYDLAQVRHDLRLFIESLGMMPVLSEFNSFPVDPSLDAVGNCLAAVKDKADVFVLIIGGRYGSETDTGKSVTNLEYLQAKAKGIPRYVFIQKGILANLPVWQNNKSADFTSVVDSAKLFEFVEWLRDPEETWTFPFESAQDIIDTLRKQMAYLFKDALDIRSKVMGSGVSESLQDLSAKALMLAVQKPFAWEYLLFAQVFADEVARSSAIKRDLEYGITLGRGVRLGDLQGFRDWTQIKSGEMISLVKSADKMVNVALAEALGAPGDVGKIVYVARRLGQVYQRLIEWSLECKQAEVEEEFAGALTVLYGWSQKFLAQLENWSRTLPDEISSSISRYQKTKEPESLVLSLTLTPPDVKAFSEELRRLEVRFRTSY